MIERRDGLAQPLIYRTLFRDLTKSSPRRP